MIGYAFCQKFTQFDKEDSSNMGGKRIHFVASA